MSILTPGCQGCLSPHEWRHDEDCPGRSQAAGHRHVEDILGRALYVGDEVVAMVRHRSGSSSHKHYLVPATVLAIMPKTVRVTYQHPAPWDPKKVTTEESNVPDHRLVKARRW